jgi:hypothetical protein
LQVRIAATGNEIKVYGNGDAMLTVNVFAFSDQKRLCAFIDAKTSEAQSKAAAT